MRSTDEGEGRRIIRRMRWLAVLLPVTFLCLLLLFTVEVLAHDLPGLAAVIIACGIGAAGVVFFSRAVFAVIEHMQERLAEQNSDLRQRTDQLRAVHEAGLQVTADLALGSVLQSVVDSSRTLVGARFAALAVVHDGAIQEFITSGLSSGERAAIGDPPQGRGLLGHVLRTGQSYRSSDVANDPHAAGFPANHPAMKTFLGIPVISRGLVIGDLYLTDKEHGEFTDEDEEILTILAIQAAIAIANARLYESLEETAVLKERERIATDLHDSAVQSLYGVGLQLESCLEELGGETPAVRQQIQGVIVELNRVVRRIRSYIFDLRPDELEGKELDECLTDLLSELSATGIVSTDLTVIDEVGRNPCRSLSREQAEQLFHIAREATANIFKHARASHVRVEVSVTAGEFRLLISDDGLGIGQPQSAAGRGLREMYERALALGAKLAVASRDGGGTIITVIMPPGMETKT
ncbi:MAG: GAF domain-containing protein [Dehalococcoidia bacterium]|nr:GAF domain-containing protein [Dehalococcoidia bacterium]